MDDSHSTSARETASELVRGGGSVDEEEGFGAGEAEVAAITLVIMKKRGDRPTEKKKRRVRRKITGRTCGNCETTESPMWRKGPSEKFLCNKCGIYLKTHGRARPLTFEGLYWFRFTAEKRGAFQSPLPV
jgi:Zn ribbon nucleic-acid-binding protein